MEKIIEKKNCSGCHACYSICPKQCIKMCEDEEGFWYPQIDKEQCVNCGACKKVCPVLKEYQPNPRGKAYACINKDEGIRMKSSSGGIFTLLASAVIEQGGVVFGVAFDSDFSAFHTYVEDKTELEKLRGSKYVQSRIFDTYKKVKEYLDLKRIVLFSGTPCQIGGLKTYLGKEYDNLIMQDIICHGVPSPLVWQKYITLRETKAGSKIGRTFFRHKKYGWKTYSVRFEFSNRTEYEQIFSKDLFMRAFLANLCLRPSCYNCHFKSKERESDITLADFWGVEKECADMYDNKGTSLVLVNSEKGKKLFEKIEDELIFKEVEINSALAHNSAAYKSVCRPKKREKFMKKVTTKNFERVVKKYSRRTFLNRCKNKFKTICKIVLKNISGITANRTE